MDLFIQMGHGMNAIANDLSDHWKGGNFILSPRNQGYEALKKQSKSLVKNGANVLFDPQFYIPRASDEKLRKHSYWPEDFSTINFLDKSLSNFVDTLYDDYYIGLGCKDFIIPSLLINDISEGDVWTDFSKSIVRSVGGKDVSGDLYLTLCISSDVILSEDKIHTLLEEVEDFAVDGFYVIPVHPSGEYLVDNARWLSNLLDFSAGLKVKGYKVILGYSNHQMLIAGLAKVDAICSGNFLKTRNFTIADFDANDKEASNGRRSIWYYSPQTLSEFQIPFLGMAFRNGVLEAMKPSPDDAAIFCKQLFSGVDPETTNFKEADSFKHYLHSLRFQCNDLDMSSYTRVKSQLVLILNTSEVLCDELYRYGVTGRKRDFSKVVDISQAAIQSFHNIRGLYYERFWNNF